MFARWWIPHDTARTEAPTGPLEPVCRTTRDHDVKGFASRLRRPLTSLRPPARKTPNPPPKREDRAHLPALDHHTIPTPPGRTPRPNLAATPERLALWAPVARRSRYQGTDRADRPGHPAKKSGVIESACQYTLPTTPHPRPIDPELISKSLGRAFRMYDPAENFLDNLTNRKTRNDRRTL